MKRTNIVIDEKKIAKARKITGLKTTREVVDHALDSLITRRETYRKLLKLQGKIHWEGNLDEMRRGRDFS